MRSIGWLSAAAPAVAAAVAAGCVKTVGGVGAASEAGGAAAGCGRAAAAGVLYESDGPPGAARPAFIDPRDGQRYPAARIGRGVWMARNLNYKTGGSSCPKDEAANCVKYGRLYGWDEAQTVCPVGRHLSTAEEWDSLMTAAGGERRSDDEDDDDWDSWTAADKKLKAKSGWDAYEDEDGGSVDGNGTDDYGFAALPGGGAPKRFENHDVFGAWWTETEYYGRGAVNARFTLHRDDLSGLAVEQSDRYSVRCVMDEGGSLTLNGSEGGTVTSEPRKTSFKAGEKVTITAVPKSGYEFSYWSGGKTADSASASATIAVRADMNVTANFRAKPSKVFGALSDARDGQKYRTVKIGKQTWTAQNLNYKADSSWCYRDSASYCKKYGRLYDWNAAASVCPTGWRLPSRDEWDVLARAVGGKAEADEDGSTVDWRGAGGALKAKTGWVGGRCCKGEIEEGGGADEYGFSALPSGFRVSRTVDYYDACIESGSLICDERVVGASYSADDAAGWWTSTESADGRAYSRYVYNSVHRLSESVDIKSLGLSVRCIADGWNKQASSPKAKRAVPAVGKPEIDMVFVKGATFKMGGGDDACKCRSKDSAHNVTLSDFYIGKYEVTQKQWTAVMGGNPSAGPVGDDYPVNNVSWEDIDEFIGMLNAATGKKYRLPTEAQWEYAVRGGVRGKGHKYSGSDNPDNVAWHEGNSGGEAHPVGTKAPNELGIYDMTGNVWELLSDRWGAYGSGDQTDPTGPQRGVARAARGCSWSLKPCQVHDRGYSPPGESSYDSGFRLVLPP